MRGVGRANVRKESMGEKRDGEWVENGKETEERVYLCGIVVEGMRKEGRLWRRK